MQRALERQTGISATEQILMFNGTVLDRSKVLQAYSLPVRLSGNQLLPTYPWCWDILNPMMQHSPNA